MKIKRNPQRDQLAASLFFVCVVVVLVIIIGGVAIKVILNLCKMIPPPEGGTNTNNMVQAVLPRDWLSRQQLSGFTLLSSPTNELKSFVCDTPVVIKASSAGDIPQLPEGVTNFSLELETAQSLDGPWSGRYYLTGQVLTGSVSFVLLSMNGDVLAVTNQPIYGEGKDRTVTNTILYPEWSDTPGRPIAFYRLRLVP